MKTPDEKYRVTHGPWGSTHKDGPQGAFIIDYLRIISSNEGGWEHVSVSLATRCPTWEEMCRVKDIFWEPEDCVLQYHPPASQYVNCHPYVLHMWRPLNQSIPIPPSWMVGPK